MKKIITLIGILLAVFGLCICHSDVITVKRHVDVTFYNATTAQCDSSPTITASNKKIRLGYCAVSYDIKKKYKLKFGDYIVVPDMGNYGYSVIYEFQDHMNRRIKNTIDIYVLTYKEAIELGRKKMKIYIIKR